MSLNNDFSFKNSTTIIITDLNYESNQYSACLWAFLRKSAFASEYMSVR